MMKLSGFQKILAIFIVLTTGMIIFRIMYSGSLRFIFLLWNLFLAWIPFKISLYLPGKKNSKRWLQFFLLGAWLLFFPNALYIITDLVHLEGRTNVPVWYDAVLLFTSATTGLILAFASLYKVESFFNKQISNSATNKLVVLCLFLGSFGVYLGRFLRWNSWDIVTNPGELAREIAVRLFFPIEYYRTWGITLFLTGLFSLCYFTLRRLPLKDIGINKDNVIHPT